MNFESNRCFSRPDYENSVNDKCFYCYKIDHVIKRHCSKFQKDLKNRKIHIVDRIVYLKRVVHDGIIRVRMWFERKQKDCVLGAEKLNNYSHGLSAFIPPPDYGHGSSASVAFFACASISALFTPAAPIIKNANYVLFLRKEAEDCFTDKKINSKMITLTHNVCHESNVLFAAIAIQKSADDKQKKTKNTVKQVFDK